MAALDAWVTAVTDFFDDAYDDAYSGIPSAADLAPIPAAGDSDNVSVTEDGTDESAFFINADVPGMPDVAGSSGSTSDIQRDSAAANAAVNQALAKLRAAAADTDTQLALNLARQAFLALGLNPSDTNELSQSKTELLRKLYYNIPEVKNYIDAYDAANGKGNLVRILNADETFAAEERDKAKARIETAWMRLLGENEMAAARQAGEVERARFESAQQQQFWTNVVFLFASAPLSWGGRATLGTGFGATLRQSGVTAARAGTSLSAAEARAMVPATRQAAEHAAASQAAPAAAGIPRAKVIGVPESSDVVTLWKAPGQGRPGVADEVRTGFDPAKYPGDGPYLATDKTIAEGFQRSYGNGLQEINIPRSKFDELVHRGVIKLDGYYEAGRSWHVPADKLAEFNEAIKQGVTNKFHP